MRLFVEFDCYADIIDVPEAVITKRKQYRNRFLDWLYDKNNRHEYWVKVQDQEGEQLYGVQFGSDAFVKWLNEKVLKKSDFKASVVERDLFVTDNTEGLPSIFF